LNRCADAQVSNVQMILNNYLHILPTSNFTDQEGECTFLHLHIRTFEIRTSKEFTAKIPALTDLF